MSGRQLLTAEQAKIVIALHHYGDTAFPINGEGELYHALARELVQGWVFVVDTADDTNWLSKIMVRGT